METGTCGWWPRSQAELGSQQSQQQWRQRQVRLDVDVVAVGERWPQGCTKSYHVNSLSKSRLGREPRIYCNLG